MHYFKIESSKHRDQAYLNKSWIGLVPLKTDPNRTTTAPYLHALTCVQNALWFVILEEICIMQIFSKNFK